MPIDRNGLPSTTQELFTLSVLNVEATNKALLATHTLKDEAKRVLDAVSPELSAHSAQVKSLLEKQGSQITTLGNGLKEKLDEQYAPGQVKKAVDEANIALAAFEKKSAAAVNKFVATTEEFTEKAWIQTAKAIAPGSVLAALFLTAQLALVNWYIPSLDEVKARRAAMGEEVTEYQGGAWVPFSETKQLCKKGLLGEECRSYARFR